jgi:hypothetical protein
MTLPHQRFRACFENNDAHRGYPYRTMIINDEILTIKDLIVANSDCEQVYDHAMVADQCPNRSAV